MSNQSDNPDQPEDLEDLTDDAEEITDQSLAVKEVPYKIYRLEIQYGSVFAGTLSQFEEAFFAFPQGISDEQKLQSIELWASDQGWSFQVDWLH